MLGAPPNKKAGHEARPYFFIFFYFLAISVNGLLMHNGNLPLLRIEPPKNHLLVIYGDP